MHYRLAGLKTYFLGEKTIFQEVNDITTMVSPVNNIIASVNQCP